MGLAARESNDLELAQNLCRNSLKFLCVEVLGYKDWDKIHDDLEIFLAKPASRKLILIPRGHLKSAVITKAWTIQRILKDPNRRVLIAHEVWDKSREMLSEIKEYLTNKSQLPLIFGKFESERWNADQIVVRQRTKAMSAPSVGTTGVESEQTSTHYDDIICDDLQGLQNVQTPEQRQKVKRFLISLLDLLEPGGNLIVVGTRWHLDDIYAEILENQGEYYDVMVRTVIEDGGLIFPKKFSLKFDPVRKAWAHSDVQVGDYVEHLRKTKGADFYAQYMNNPIDVENQLFRKEYFKYFNARPAGLYVSLKIDPAISEKQMADYTAITVAGMDKDYKIYVLDYLRGHWKPSEMIDNIFKSYSTWHPHDVGLETVGFQKALKYAIEEEMRKRKIYFPLTELKRQVNNKEFHIRALEPFYRDGMVFHAQWMAGKDLEHELMTFPRSKHDDLTDSLAMHLQVLVPGHERRDTSVKEGTWEWWAKMAHEANQPYRGFFNYGDRI